MADSAPTLASLQTLRAIAALSVIFVHVNKLLIPLGLPPFGGGGVDLFFVISGFIMVYTTSHEPPPPGRFIARRLLRVLPLYWLLTLITFVAAPVVSPFLHVRVPSAVDCLKSLLFIPFEKSNGMVTPILFVGWTLNYEIFFYVLFALGLGFRRYALGMLSVLSATLGLALIGVVVKPGGVIAAFYTDPVLTEFALGMIAAMALKRSGSVASSKTLLIASLTGMALLVTLLGPVFYPGLSRVLSSGLPAAVAVYGAAFLERSGLTVTRPWLIRLGNASYSIYLTHTLITQAIETLASPPPRPLIAILLLAILVPSVCLLGVVVHATLERPLFLRLRRLAESA